MDDVHCVEIKSLLAKSFLLQMVACALVDKEVFQDVAFTTPLMSRKYALSLRSFYRTVFPICRNVTCVIPGHWHEEVWEADVMFYMVMIVEVERNQR
jgi:hypothetical protein